MSIDLVISYYGLNIVRHSTVRSKVLRFLISQSVKHTHIHTRKLIHSLHIHFARRDLMPIGREARAGHQIANRCSRRCKSVLVRVSASPSPPRSPTTSPIDLTHSGLWLSVRIRARAILGGGGGSGSVGDDNGDGRNGCQGILTRLHWFRCVRESD